MPLYSYQCHCGHETDAFNRVAERHTSAPFCGINATHGRMGVKIRPVLGYVQRDCHYMCPVTGKEVTTNRMRNNIMREHDLIDANDFPPQKGIEREQKKKARRDELIAGLDKPILFQ